MLPEFTTHDLAAAYEACAADLLAQAGILAPPVDAFAVATVCGLTIAADDRQSTRARFVRLGRHAPGFAAGSILLRPDPRPERLQWAVAHEIGEFGAQRVFELLGIQATEAPEGAREIVANRLAAHLLLPTAWFFADAKRWRWDLPRLKRQYATASHELIARRMLDGAPQVIISVFDQGRISWRKWQHAGRPPQLTAEERRTWQKTHERGEHGRLCTPMLSVQSWAVHEPDWKREILRTETPDFDECAA